MTKIAVFPGSFDPITLGHEDLIKRALPLFDEVIIAIGINSLKKYKFSLEQRLACLEDLFKEEDRVSVASYEGLTTEFCKKKNAHFILRGIRSVADLEFERNIAQVNKEIGEEIETVFLISDPRYSHISSSIVRELIKFDGNIDSCVSITVLNWLEKQKKT